MLAKKYKLNIGEFIKKRPTHVRKGPFFAIKTMTNGLSYDRFGVVVGKKVNKRATRRNKIKRMFYEAIRHQLKQGGVGIDVMVQIYPEIDQYSIEKTKEVIKEFNFVT